MEQHLHLSKYEGQNGNDVSLTNDESLRGILAEIFIGLPLLTIATRFYSFPSTQGSIRFLFLLNSVVNATFCDDQSASSMKGCFARIWELVFTRNNSKFFSKIFRQISNFAKIIFLLLVVPLNACILLTYFHAFLLSTKFRYWFYWLIRNSQPVLDLKAVATARGYHYHCCSNTLRRIFLWVAQAD